MTRFEAGRTSLSQTADALAALFRGDDNEAAEVGALVLADAVDCLRAVRSALTSKKGARRG